MGDVLITRRGVDTTFEGQTPKGTEWMLLYLASDEQIMSEKEIIVIVRAIQAHNLEVDIVRK